MARNNPTGATVYGIDLGKNLFRIVGTDSGGAIMQRAKFRAFALHAGMGRRG